MKCPGNKSAYSSFRTYIISSACTAVENVVSVPLSKGNNLSDRNEISPKTVRDNLKNSTCWKRYTNSQKVDLLSFILQDGNWGDLGGIELLPSYGHIWKLCKAKKHFRNIITVNMITRRNMVKNKPG
jgi:hypothetical protein